MCLGLLQHKVSAQLLASKKRDGVVNEQFEECYGKLNNITCVVGLMLGEIHKNQQSQKCDQEPIFKIYIGHIC